LYLRPTFLGFETAKRGLTVAQKGLDIAGQNLTNWDSVGYTRQRTTQVAIATDSYRSRYSTGRVGLAGQGVDITGIDQTRDVFLDKRFREENSDVGYFDQSSKILIDIQASINEYNPKDDTGLRSCIMNINDALQKFSTNAYSETHANIVATEFKNLAQTLQQISGKLQSARSQQVYDLDVSVQEVNKKLQQIGGLNHAIMESMSGVIGDNPYFGPNELLDERNLLLDELSQYIDIQYKSNADGTITVESNGRTIVSGEKYDQLSMVEDEKTDVVGVRWVSTNEAADIQSGSVKAQINYLNGRGPNLKNPGESAERGFFYYQDKLDAFAQTLVNTVNRIIPEVDEDGNIMKDADGNIVYRQLMGALSSEPDADGKYHVRDDIPVTADNLSISDRLSTDSGYLIFQRSEDGTADNVSNYALSLYHAISDGTQLFDSNGEEFTGTFLDYVKGYVTTLAEDISYLQSRHTATSTILNTLQDNRDEVSGVVVDEEVANVMLYQKTLSAASRLMTAMDEALDVIINRTGRVGL